MSLEIATADVELTVEPGASVTVGRLSGSSVQIDDPRVSREHLRVYAVEGRWILEDRGSSYGTYLDGRRVQRITIEDATTVQLGDPGDGPWLRLTPAVRSNPVVGPTAAYELSSTSVTVGRDPQNQIVLDDPLVSRRHAEFRRLADGRWTLVDLGSFNGTFVNGVRLEETRLEPLDLIGIGASQFRFTGSRLAPVADEDEIALAAVGITITSRAGATLVADAGFTLAEGSLLAVVGPSGAGKSTLLGALTGLKPAPRGSVYFGGRDLYAEYDALRQRIGFVPQDDVVHPELTVQQSLEYAAELRFAPDVTREERRARVEEVMGELGLIERRQLVVGKLSGGQRKRVSVALELLTKPALLFLDEPASGLDPGLERTLMELLRALADAGRTIVVVTHSTESLNLCDRVLFLAPGGRTAYFGPPQLALAYFDRADYQEVFRDLSSGDPDEWSTRFRADELARRYLDEPLSGYSAGTRPSASIGEPGARQPWLRQLWMLTRRYSRVLAGDRANVVLLVGAGPVIGLLQLWRLPADQLASSPLRVVSEASIVLLVITIAMTMIGLSNSLREIVKELPVFRRERAVGLSTSAYVASKVLVLSVITACQAAVYIALATAGQGGPTSAVVLGWPLGELIVAGALTGIAAVALGLAVSAMVNSTNAAIALLPALLIGQLLIMPQGVFNSANKPVLAQLGYVSSAGWGFAATASTVKLNQLEELSNIASSIPAADLHRPIKILQDVAHSHGNARWNHQPGAWLRAIAALLAITLASLALAVAVLRRFDPL
jgi:ABC-type multidrug transport system ATPase subunit/pSer/pThr/pTyr-binding forkhead associated (FHA) protein